MRKSLFITGVLLLTNSLCFAAIRRTGFPEDFPALIDSGGLGQGTTLTGFGGDIDKTRLDNRASVKKTPVILIHGNGAHALHPKWGMLQLRSFLIEVGYNPSEVWGVSYLGKDNSQVDMTDPHRNNVDDIRNFVRAVREYLGVKKVDFIAHSLGAALLKACLSGFQKNGSWDYSSSEYEFVGTMVSLSGAFYGLGPFSIGEFKSGSSFEKAIHLFNEFTEDTPLGASSKEKQEGDYVDVTELDNDRVAYVNFWAKGDFVDMQNANTGRLEGANVNRSYNLGLGLVGHEKIIKDKKIFSDLLPYLDTQRVTRQ